MTAAQELASLGLFAEALQMLDEIDSSENAGVS